MVTKPEPKIQEGKELLKVLDKKGLSPEVAMWFYIPEGNIWRYIISSSSFGNTTNRDLYSNFVKKFRDTEQVKNIGLENITLLPKNNYLIVLFKTVIRTGPKDCGDIRFTSSVINGILIEDAVIYRIA